MASLIERAAQKSLATTAIEVSEELGISIEETFDILNLNYELVSEDGFDIAAEQLRLDYEAEKFAKNNKIHLSRTGMARLTFHRKLGIIDTTEPDPDEV